MFSRRTSRRFSAVSAAVLFLALVFLTATDGPQRLFAQTQTQQIGLLAGRNVNMVSGTKWPDGDPYLQRQNEPSVAGSTRNPQHLLAGANDYRTVDLPFVTGADETGDAWLGVFKSYDGGARWRTTLLPGYPQDTTPEGLASPIHGYDAGADPVVRAGTNGLFYYAGLVFDRVENGRSAVFVARFVDNNNQEDTYKNNPRHVAGDPITYLGTRVVARNSGTRFLDKPWIAVDVPRDGRFCSIPKPGGGTQRVPAGNVYIAYSSIYSDNQGLRSDIYLSRSQDCGATWSVPVRVSDASDRVNQGATMAIDPLTGNVHIAWRRFAAGTIGTSQVDGIMSAISTDRGGRFSAPGVCRAFERGRGRKVGLDPERYFEHRTRRKGGDDHDRRDADANDKDDKGKGKGKPGITPPRPVDEEFDEFDQATSDINEFLMFRTNAYPTMAVDGTGRVYVAWTERGFVPGSPDEARVVMSTSTNGRTWTTPAAVASESTVGHQLMPTLTFGGGRLVLVYYDFREDYSGQFTRSIDDKRAIQYAGKRHTMDLRASVALPATRPAFQPSVRVSDYLLSYAQLPDGTLVQQQGQFNAPNLPMFKQGTAPFMGDYIDVAVSPAFVPAGNNRWVFNTDGAQPVFHAVWTDNRDVRQPKQDPDGDGNPWNNYTPPSARNANGPAQSLFDPTKQMPTCDPQKTASRNQNIYTARLSLGLVVGSPGNSKPLSPTIQRAFVVFAQNTTSVTKAFRLTILNQPTGGRASFRQFDLDASGAMIAPLTQLIVTTPPKSTAARSVYATSTNPYAQIQVDVVEVPYNGSISAVPLADRILLNPDIANPDIANPDIANPDIANPDIANAEVYNPDIANPDIANPDIANPDIANPDIANPDIANPDIANPDIANPDIANPDIANPDIANKTVSNPDIANPDIANPDIANPDIANPDIANPDIANPDIANPDIANASLSDVTWTMTNDGNTTAAFNVNLFLSQQSSKLCAPGQDPKTTGCVATQLILRKVYSTPVANGCEVALQTQNIVIANIRNPQFVLPGQSLPNQNSSDPTNATLWLAPGEKAQITLRVFDPNKLDNVPVTDTDTSTPTPGGSKIDPLFLPTTKTDLGSVTPIVQQQAVDTQDVQTAKTAGTPPPPPPIVTPLSPQVPNAADDPAPTPLALQFVLQPTAVQAGAPFATSVRVFDQYGHALPGATVTLFVGANPNPATTPALGGNVAVTDATGLAAFPGVTIAPAAIGYTLVATAGQALPAVSGLFTASAQPATVQLSDLTQTYDGTAKSASVTTVPNGLSTVVTYDGSQTLPINPGSYAVVATIVDPIYTGAASGTFTITNACNPLVVTNTGDSAACGSLRAAIEYANGNPGADTITFNIPGPGPHLIAPATALPTITGPLTIDATMQAGFSNVPSPSPAVYLDGRSTVGGGTLWTGTAPGLEVYSVPVTLRGLGVSGFSGPGVLLFNNSDNSVIEQSTFGTTLPGSPVATPNNVGIRVTYSKGVVIQGNVLAGNTIDGVLLVGGSDIEVLANRIGVPGQPNGNNGVTMYDGTLRTRIENNVIRSNAVAGVDLQQAGAPVAATRVLNNTFVSNGVGPVRNGYAPGTVISAPIDAKAGGLANVNFASGAANTGGIDPLAAVFFQPGETAIVTATGSLQCSAAPAVGPDGGAGATDPSFLAPGLPGCSLVARIGNGPWQAIGDGPTALTASVGGLLEFAVNDSLYSDNTGTWQVTVAINPVYVPGTAGGASNANCNFPVGNWLCGGGAGGTAPVDTGVFLNVGKSVTISATGQINPGGGYSAPDPSGNPVGSSGYGPYFLAPDAREFALLARIGTGPWQDVGAGPTTVTANGAGGMLQLAFNDTAYDDNTGAFLVTLDVPPTAATVQLNNLSQTYDGSQKTVTVTTTPAGLTTSVTYDGNATAPTGAGSYAVQATVTQAGYTGSASGTLVVGKATATVQLANLSQTADGSPKPASATTTPGGLTVDLTYNGSPTAPSAAGSYAVDATVNDANYQGGASGTLVINAAAPTTATIAITGFSSIYEAGVPKPVTVVTTPLPDLSYTATYNGSATVPTAIGAYFVSATIDEPGYTPASTAAIHKIASTLAAGGPGGAPYSRYCEPGAFVNGIGVSPPTESLWNAKLLCSAGSNPANFGNTDTFPYNTADNVMACPANHVMVGLTGRAGAISWASNVVIAVAPICRSLLDGTTTTPFAAAPGSATGTPFSFSCQAGEGVTGVVGGAGSVVDSLALACAPLPAVPTITSVPQVPAGKAFAQAITVLGTNLPAGGSTAGPYPREIEQQVVFTQGGIDYPSTEVYLATSTKWILLVPQALADGPATVRLKNVGGTTTTNAFPITVSSTPAAPVLQSIFQASSDVGFTTTPVTSLTPGAWLTVEADGVSTSAYLATYVFTPASGAANAKTATGWAANVGGTSGGIRHTVQVPSDLDVSGWVDVQVYVFGPSPLSNTIRIGSGPAQ